MIDQETKKQLKQMLLTEQAKIHADLDRFTLEDTSAPGGHESVMTDTQIESDVEDQADDAVALGKKESLESMMEKRLEEIAHALVLIDTPQYGLCEVDQKEIPLERLKVNPAATTCIEHAPRY